MAPTLCQKWFYKTRFFLSCSLDHTILFKFPSIWYKHSLRNVWRNFRLPMSALATVAEKFTPKIDFPIGYFILPLLILDIESLKSLHTLFYKYLDHMLVEFKQNRMVRTITKMVNHFWFDAISEDVSVNEIITWCLTINSEAIIFQCSKNDGSPTRVTRLKVEPNMADPISLNEKRP